jgi:prepilin-type N-terminal cleavage/methylation domain-containing protein
MPSLPAPFSVPFWTSELASRHSRKRKISNSKLRNKGFSLIELIIVIAIMAILAAAIAPALLRYIDKSRKAVDLETAQTIYEAANLASASWDDDVAAGWTVALKSSAGSVARTTVTSTGHNASKDKSDKNTYKISCVAWSRGMNYGGNWQNAKFKSTIDTGANGDLQRKYTNEFLKNLVHDSATGGIYYGTAGVNNFDGFSAETMLFKYLKDSGYGKPECWMLCINESTQKPEVWIGDKNINSDSTHKVRPLYRLYPDPCVEYQG